VGADVALGIYVLNYVIGSAGAGYAWTIALFLLPFPPVLLAPIYGLICDRYPRSRVFTGAAFFGAALLALFPSTAPTLWFWGLLSTRAALYRVALGALLPTAAADARIALTRVNGLFMAAAAGVVFFLLFGQFGHNTSAYWRKVFVYFPLEQGMLAHGLSLACLAFALLALFPGDILRPRHGASLQRFFTDSVRVLRDGEARLCLVGLAGLSVLLAVLFGHNASDFYFQCLYSIPLVGGLAAGALVPCLQGHPRRALCFVPLGMICLAADLVEAAPERFLSLNTRGHSILFVAGFLVGMMFVPLITAYQLRLPRESRGNGMALLGMAQWLGIGFITWSPYWRNRFIYEQMGWIIAVITILAALYSCWAFRREILEQLLEFPFAVMYRIRAAGPGVEPFPLRGPVLVIANHTCWMDPLLLAKVLPRSLVPMMTSLFFDMPLLRWSMVHIIGAIRVEESRYRREAPELQDAVAALDRGECVVLFPEGEMRKRADKPLKRFAQGAWHILRERPETPLVVCWIEGGWGSYFSYFNGPPTRNKRFDLRHPVTIAIAAPQQLPAKLLDDQMETRHYLMRECLRMREALGLPPVALEQPEAEER
jgi:1-acyl-sn-glycerol-3-phosphate acyltransferase